MFPSKPFETVEIAKEWMSKFTSWYNTEHLHSGINFVTPDSKHKGEDVEILAARVAVYEEAKQKNPNRWSGATRNWEAVKIVKLNPLKEKRKENTKLKCQLAS